MRVGGQLGFDYCPITGGCSDLTLILSFSLCFQVSNSLAWLSIASRSYNSSQNKTQIEIRLNCVTGNGEEGIQHRNKDEGHAVATYKDGGTTTYFSGHLLSELGLRCLQPLTQLVQ